MIARTPILVMACLLGAGGAQAQELAPAPAEGASTAEAPAPVAESHYRLSGDRALRPVRITDDGVHMYLEWSPEQDLPAVFSVGTLGEGMVEGYMRGGIFIIDRVYGELVFRIDKKWARARRVANR